MFPRSLSHMLRCLPAPKSICSVNKLASLTARKLPLGSQSWEESHQTFPLRVLTWTPRQNQARCKWQGRQRVLVPALAPSGAGCSRGVLWLEARPKWGRCQLLSVIKWRFLAQFLELPSPRVLSDIHSFPCCSSRRAGSRVWIALVVLWDVQLSQRDVPKRFRAMWWGQGEDQV